MHSANKTNLRSLINQVTKEKLALLDLQRQTLKTHFTPILDKYERPENKASVVFLKEVYSALKSCSVTLEHGESNEDLAVFLNWVNAEDADAVLYFGSEHLVRQFLESLIKSIRFQLERCEYSCLYANVMTQYMDLNSDDMEVDDVVIVESAEDGSKTDKEKTIQEYSERVFTAPTDFKKEDFSKFLETQLFDTEDAKQRDLLYNIRLEVKELCEKSNKNWLNNLDNDDIKLVIDGLLAEDLLPSEKAVTLKELRENDDALNEVKTLLKNRISNFATWSWPAPVHVEFRRNMAGRYRAYLDEDIITALFLHYIGAMWSIQMKKMYCKIYSSNMWKRGTGTVGDLYYKNHSIEGFRRDFHSKSFLSILPSQLKDLAATGAIYDERDQPADVLTPMKVKQKLLHLICNEVKLNNTMRPQTPFLVAQTDIEWFGPSLMHDAILALMEFFGMTKPWLNFFKTFLESPLRVGSDSAPVQIRKRGVPLSHSLSALFGESLLFIMDLHVNQVSGLSLFRIHDDFWFWSHTPDRVTKAWTAIETYAKVGGLKLNAEKSASVLCKQGTKPSEIIHVPGLPQVNVKWGFVVLHSDGTLYINKALLEPHIEEMSDCLRKCDTVMSWVHCHNRYIRFFIRNFAEPALIFGKQHIIQITTTLQEIFKQVHKEANGEPVEALRKKFEKIWGDKDVMDSWVHWPVEQGGLGLYNPFLDFIPLHEAYRKNEEKDYSSHKGAGSSKFSKVIDDDITKWEKVLEESKKRRKRRFVEDPAELDAETITDMEASDEEFYDREERKTTKRKNYKKRVGYEMWCDRYRESMWGRWRSRYVELLTNLKKQEPQDEDADCWRDRMYERQLEEKFGSSSFINTNLIPLSLITAMQKARVHNN